MNCKDCTYVSGESEYWCDKVGGKISFFGTCGDFEEPNHQPNHLSHYNRRKNKYERRLVHLEKVKNKSKLWHGYYIKITNSDKSYSKRYYRGNHTGNRFKFYKEYSNRIVRHYRGELHRGNAYRKVFDYWWTVD